jgi:nucleoside-diphosphate-sugar epimerase
MRIFLTGATGYVGSAVTDALLRSGHEVTALVRDPEKAERVTRRGVHAIVGELSRPASYAAAAEAADSIVHAALDSSPRKQKVDHLAIDTLVAAAARRAAAGLPARLVYTSGTWVLGEGAGRDRRHAGESHSAGGVAARTTSSSCSTRPGRAFGPWSFGRASSTAGARGIVGDLLKDAANGLVRVVGTGQNHWACIYDRDLA